MEKMKFKAKMSEEETRALEKAWYELQGDQSTIAFCMAQPGINWEAMTQYRQVMAEEFALCEKLKHSLASKYMPNEVKEKGLNKFNYSFDFEDCEIIFEEG